MGSRYEATSGASDTAFLDKSERRCTSTKVAIDILRLSVRAVLVLLVVVGILIMGYKPHIHE